MSDWRTRYEAIKADPEKLAKLRKRNAEHSRDKYRRIKADPDRYAKYLEMKRRIREKSKDKINAKRNAWRKSHKRRRRLELMRQTSLRHLLWRECPEAWALYRAYKRDYQQKWLRKTGKVKREYRPRVWFRIPDECSWGNVMDRRSVFLWNNSTAASLLAGREFQRMMWREAHCDRFGEVCR